MPRTFVRRGPDRGADVRHALATAAWLGAALAGAATLAAATTLVASLLAGRAGAQQAPPPTAAPCGAAAATSAGSAVRSPASADNAAAAAAGCSAAPYRAFDFWLGSWEVRGRADRLVGASRVTPALGGCAVEERWRVAAGVGGRSINAYDRRDGRWHQFWVDRGANVLRLSGAPAPTGAMVMYDAPGVDGPAPPHDRIGWTPLDGARVEQRWDTATVTTSVDSAPWRPSFVGIYSPRRDSVVLPPRPATATATMATPAVAPCRAASGPYRALDFLVGDWTVHVGRRDGPVAGRRAVVRDLDDCLTVSADFDAAGTYRGITYAAYDARTARWYRESVDDEGRRLVLVGDTLPAASTMMASAGGAALGMRELRETTTTSSSPPAASVSLDPLARVTWRVLPGGAVAERWERSADGGGTWRVARDLVLTPR